MNKRLLIIIAAVVAVALILVFLVVSRDDAAPTTETNTTTEHSSTEEEHAAEEHVVTYDGTSFSPTSLTVKHGDTVMFMNKGSSPMWVASDPHPVHTDYDGFDAKTGISPGQSYSFTFDDTGTWGYHNHLSSSHTGTIIVE